MICEIEDDIAVSLQGLKGTYLQLNKYRFGENAPNDGYVLTGATEYYFIKADTREIDEQYKVHLLLLEKLENDEVNEDIRFEPIVEGELVNVHLFKHTQENLSIKGAVVDHLITECAMILNFEGIPPILIYPKDQLMGSSAIEQNTDAMLDIINKMGLKHSRTL